MSTHSIPGSAHVSRVVMTPRRVTDTVAELGSAQKGLMPSSLRKGNQGQHTHTNDTCLT